MVLNCNAKDQLTRLYQIALDLPGQGLSGVGDDRGAPAQNGVLVDHG